MIYKHSLGFTLYVLLIEDYYCNPSSSLWYCLSLRETCNIQFINTTVLIHLLVLYFELIVIYTVFTPSTVCVWPNTLSLIRTKLVRKLTSQAIEVWLVHYYIWLQVDQILCLPLAFVLDFRLIPRSLIW